MNEEQTGRDERGTKAGGVKASDRKRADISIILDRSGSMECRVHEAIESFNGFLREQRGVVGKAKVSLVQFDHEYEPLYTGVKLADAPGLDEETYRPRGRTALLDAIGRTVVATQDRLARRAKNRQAKGKDVDAPDVLVVVITDGLENDSREYSNEGIKRMITSLERDHDWNFLFMGTTQESIVEAQRFGVHGSRAFNMGSTPEDYEAAQQLMGGKVRTMRMIQRDKMMEFKRQKLAFTEQERQAVRDREAKRRRDESPDA